MIQKARGNKKNSKLTKVSKPAKKLTSTKRVIENSRPLPKTATDEAYDRGFNDGYSKGLEDGGLDESG